MASSPPATPHHAPLSIDWLGYFIGALGSAMFATKGIVIKLALLQNVDAATTLTWRMLIAMPIFILVGWLGYRHQKSKDPTFGITLGQTGKIALIGMLGYYLASYLDFQGLEHISAQFDRLILLTYPFFVVLFGAIWFRTKVSRTAIVALIVSYIGLALIFAHDLSLDGGNVVIGTALVLGAAISYALYQLFAKALIDQVGARLFTSIAMTGAGIVIIAQFLLTHSATDLIVSPHAMWLMLAMGTVSTVFPAYLISTSIGRIGPAPTAIIGNVSPIVTIAMAVGILHEVFSVYHAIGAVLVIASILVFTRAEKRAAQAAAQRIAPKL